MIVLCITILLCCMMMCVTYYVTHKPAAHKESEIDWEALDRAYESIEADPIPDFTDIINEINKEFGGVDYGE